MTAARSGACAPIARARSPECNCFTRARPACGGIARSQGTVATTTLFRRRHATRAPPSLIVQRRRSAKAGSPTLSGAPTSPPSIAEPAHRKGSRRQRTSPRAREESPSGGASSSNAGNAVASGGSGFISTGCPATSASRPRGPQATGTVEAGSPFPPLQALAEARSDREKNVAHVAVSRRSERRSKRHAFARVIRLDPSALAVR